MFFELKAARPGAAQPAGAAGARPGIAQTAGAAAARPGAAETAGTAGARPVGNKNGLVNIRNKGGV